MKILNSSNITAPLTINPGNTSGTQDGLILTDAGGGAIEGLYIGWRNGDSGSTNLAQIHLSSGTIGNGGNLIFSTNAGSTSAISERMRITAGGSVGIGTTSPESLLTVGAVRSPYTWSSTAEFRNSLAVFDASQSSSGLRIGFTSNKPFLQGYRETVGVIDLLLQNSGGKVGIGTASPTAELHVVDSNPELLRIERSTGGNAVIAAKSAGGTVFFGKPNIGNFAAGPNVDLNTSPYFTVGTDGSFGIGTGITPISKLEVSGGNIMLDNNTSIIFRTASGGTTTSALTLTTANNLQINGIATNQYYASTNHQFYTGAATERMRITSGGSVFIGATGGTAKLEVAGSASFSGEITSTLAQGTAPFTVGSSTLVSNLNAQYLNGISSAGFVATSNGALLNPSLTRVDSSQEGGQLNFNRPSDDTVYWILDTYGTSTAPSFRTLEMGSVTPRLQIDPGGVVKFNGSAGSSGQVLTSQGSASAPIWTTVSGGGGGSGTVTSVAATVPSIMTISGTPVTSSGTLAFGLATQNANLVFAGPASGAAATPTFRSLAVADIPSLGSSYLSKSGGTLSGGLALSSGNVTIQAGGIYAYNSDVSEISGLNIGNVGAANTTILGVAAGMNNLTGDFNTAIGSNALYFNTGGSANIAIGSNAMASMTQGDYNIAIGVDALGSCGATVNYNIGIGSNSLNAINNGTNNLAIGRNAGSNIYNGSYNILIGSGDSGAGWGLSNESNNTIIGELPGETGMTSTVLLGAGATERFRINSTNAYINGSTYGLISVAGGTFLGVVAGVTPTSSQHLATKAYVDANAGGGSGSTTATDALAIAWLGL